MFLESTVDLPSTDVILNKSLKKAVLWKKKHLYINQTDAIPLEKGLFIFWDGIGEGKEISEPYLEKKEES